MRARINTHYRIPNTIKILTAIFLGSMTMACTDYDDDDISFDDFAQGSISSEISLADITIQEYAQQCGEIIGAEMPAFQCSDGELIKIKKDATGKCLNSPLLGNNECTDSQRIGIVEIPGKPEIQISFICRVYEDGHGADMYNDIAVIHHNKDSGATCWYQSDTNVYKSGSNIPTPSSPGATGFWYELEEKGPGNINCSSCHEVDPFLITPFLGNPISNSTTFPDYANVPRNPKGKYWSYLFPQWDTKEIIQFDTPVANDCTQCHRMPARSASSTCGQFSQQAIVHHWMPFPAAVARFNNCCDSGIDCTEVAFQRKDLVTLTITQTFVTGDDFHLKATLTNAYSLNEAIKWSRSGTVVGESLHGEEFVTERDCNAFADSETITAEVKLPNNVVIAESFDLFCPKTNSSSSYADENLTGTVSESGQVVINQKNIMIGDLVFHYSTYWFYDMWRRMFTSSTSVTPAPDATYDPSLTTWLTNYYAESATRGFMSFPTYPKPGATGVEKATLFLMAKQTGAPFSELGSLGVTHVNYGDSLDASDFAGAQYLPGFRSIERPVNYGYEIDVTSIVQEAWNLKQQIGNRVQFLFYFSSPKRVNGHSDFLELYTRYKQPDGSINYNNRRPILKVTYKFDE